jgi:hypothetical protein
VALTIAYRRPSNSCSSSSVHTSKSDAFLLFFDQQNKEAAHRVGQKAATSKVTLNMSSPVSNALFGSPRLQPFVLSNLNQFRLIVANWTTRTAKGTASPFSLSLSLSPSLSLSLSLSLSCYDSKAHSFIRIIRPSLSSFSFIHPSIHSFVGSSIHPFTSDSPLNSTHSITLAYSTKHSKRGIKNSSKQ